ncbi:MAG TPA: mercury(II) reductase [Actinomycetota bacterium]|jgi:mercuric reductase|nr:mercury(II) reductase [Actinomycetota bacterium]
MTKRATLTVEGMTCQSCERHVAAALQRAGAEQVTASWRAGQANFVWPDGVAEQDLRAAVSATGYRPGALAEVPEPQPHATAPRSPSAGIDVDLLVLGGGSAAFAAAITARDAGARVALAEAGTLGGTCVNVGCVPSKALLRAGELAWQAGHHPFAGLATSSGPVDLAALIASKDELVAELRQAKYADLVDAYGLEVIAGHARFTGPDTVAVGDRPLRPGAVLIATGASPTAPPIPGLAEAGYLTSTTALDLKEVPSRLAVIGANAVGLELGQFFLHLGAQVTFLDIADQIAPLEEPEAAAALTQVLTAQGATIHTPAQVLAVDRDGEARHLRIRVDGTQRTIDADEMLVATGRRPNTAELDLEAAGIAIDQRGAIVVDQQLRTSNPRVWAAGDVTPSPQFVYVAAAQGALAADNALHGAGRTVDHAGLPRVIFTSPQLAAAGPTQAQAQTAGHQVHTTVLPLAAVPRALVNRDTRGLVKLVADATSDRLLGATIVADGAGDAIQTAVLAIRAGMITAELATTVHPYLTMVEGLKLAAQTFTRDVDRLSCCAP